MDRVLNKRTTWFLVNIKAREEQTEEHYVFPEEKAEVSRVLSCLKLKMRMMNLNGYK